MKSFAVNFTIQSQKNCPLYEVGENLLLSEKTLSCPEGKEVCLILVRDLTALLFNFLQDQPVDISEYKDSIFNCSGCKGLIKFAVTSPLQNPSVEELGAIAEMDSQQQEILDVLARCKIFQSLDEPVLHQLVAATTRIHLQDDGYLLHKGQENQNIYIVASGSLIVEDDELIIATLKEHEICGEMSYLGGDTAVSSVRADGEAAVIAVGGEVFGRVLGQFPVIQTHMARLLAARLRQMTETRSREFGSCMTGRIDEILPAEIFQVFHMHQKTGELSLELPLGQGRVGFKTGQIVRAEYAGLEDESAVYKILKEKNGTYRFTTGLRAEDEQRDEIADFMMLLMEGVRQTDEDEKVDI